MHENEPLMSAHQRPFSSLKGKNKGKQKIQRVCPKFCVKTAGQCKIEQNISRRERRQLLPPCLQNNSSLRACQGRRRQPPFISTLDMPVCSRSLRHAIRKEYSQLSVDHAPVLPSASPFLRDIHHGQIEHFQQAVIRGKHGFCLGHFPELAVEALDGVGRIDQAANLLGVYLK